jgi:ATP-binding cassette subfamily B (MDR/TAP) protein 1
MVCGFTRIWLLAHFENYAKTAYTESAGYASEAISAIRTVASLTREQDVLESYQRSVQAQVSKGLRSVLKVSILYAMGEAFLLLSFALGFWYGGKLFTSGEYTGLQFFTCIYSVLFSAQSVGGLFAFSSDLAKAKSAAQELKSLFERKPRIDAWSAEGEDATNVTGSIEFRDVHFNYPNRLERPVLKGFNMVVKPGQHIVLVGASGCGKSTTLALIQRFYDPTHGTIRVDGRDISTFNLGSYRSLLGLVSQEPAIYSCSIRDNILLGTPLTEVSQDTVDEACKAANIYDFIMSLPWVSFTSSFTLHAPDCD